MTNRPVLLVLLAALAAGCRNTGPATIAKFEGPTEVNSGDTAEYVCDAWDWYLEPISFQWTASRGTLIEQAEGPTVTHSEARWAAPESSGTASVRVAVVDLDNEVTRDSVAVKVKKVTRTVINNQGVIKAGETHRWSDSLNFGHQLRGWVEVDTGTTSILLLDPANYQRWATGDTYEALFETIRVRKDSVSVGVTASGRYFFLLDNRAGKLAQDYQFRLFSTSP